MLCQKNTLYVRNTKKTLEISVHVDSRYRNHRKVQIYVVIGHMDGDHIEWHLAMLDHAGLKTNEEKRKGFTTNFGYRQSRRVLASSSSMDLYVEQASTYSGYK